MTTIDLSLLPNPENGLVQLAGPDGITSPPGTDLSESQTPRIIAASITLISLSTTAVILRLIARKLSRAGFWWDDWAILGALLLSWGTCVCMVAATTKGFGRHAAYYTDYIERLIVVRAYFKIFYAYEIMYTISVVLCKYSILLFYSRIFTERPFRISLYVLYIVNTMLLLSGGITVFAECVPISGLWTLSEPARCVNLNMFFTLSGIPNILANIAIVFLPIPMIWNLEIERKDRIALFAVFSLGGLVIAASIARVIVLARTPLTDITWNLVDAAIWTSIEPSIAVVSACLPILRSLWIWRKKRTPTRTTNTTKTTSRPPTQSSTVGRSQAAPKSFTPKNEKRSRRDSLRKPINELSGELDNQWGAYPSSLPSRSQSNKKTDYESENISLHDLPTRREERLAEKTPAIEEPLPKPIPSPETAKSEKKLSVAELYGS